MNRKVHTLGYFLLMVYLIVVWVQSVNPLHNFELSSRSASDSHQHVQNGDTHHDHLFHIGIFHFLGHLSDIIKQTDQQADDHVIMGAEYANSTVMEHASVDHAHILLNITPVSPVDSESLTDPPEELSVLNSSLRINTPLRAPPAQV